MFHVATLDSSQKRRIAVIFPGAYRREKSRHPEPLEERIAADPDSDQSQKYLAIQKRLLSVSFYENKVESAVKKSHVGTRLMQQFKASVGAVPCSACKQTMIRLDMMSVYDIRANHEPIVLDIEKNARKAKTNWWANLMIKADEMFTDGIVTRLLISKLLADACDDEDNEAANALLGSDSMPADMGIDTA